MRTVAVVALKGGSGKTTLAAHVALAAHLRDVDTLLVDMDPQHSAIDVMSSRVDDGPKVIAATGATLMATQFAAVGAGTQLMVIDTAAGAIEDVSEALVLADYAVLVARPTLIDLAGLARSVGVVKRIGKPWTVVVSQAPIPREGIEPPLVKRAMKALEFLRAPVAPVILRARTTYQTALEKGRSVEETSDGSAALEVADLWRFLQGELQAAADAGAA